MVLTNLRDQLGENQDVEIVPANVYEQQGQCIKMPAATRRKNTITVCLLSSNAFQIR